MTPWVQRLLVANVVLYVVTRLNVPMMNELTFVPALVLFRPWTLVTYAFLHAGFAHIALNMLMLFFFGPRLEERLGSRTFIWFYLACAVGGALLSFAFSPRAGLVGASGAIFGIVIGFARYWPREDIYIWGILPVQARMLALFMVLSSLFAGVTGAQDGIGHFAHLGGLLTGWIFLRTWEHRRRQWARPQPRRAVPRSDPTDADRTARWKNIRVDALHEINRKEVEQLLDKLRRAGSPRALTREERAFLDRLSG